MTQKIIPNKDRGGPPRARPAAPPRPVPQRPVPEGVMCT
jgi:hypothetical protein